MRNIFVRLILITGLLASTASLAQGPRWQIANPIANQAQINSHGKAYFSTEPRALRSFLHNAPRDSSGDNSYIISLPLPDGSLSRYSLVESPIMADALAARYPEIKTYKVFGVDDPAASGRVDITPRGFHAMLHTAQGRVTIDPEAGLYRAQWRKGGGGNSEFQCRTGELATDGTSSSSTTLSTTSSTTANRISNNILVYRLALSATVEYVTAVGGDPVNDPVGARALALAEIVTAISRVNFIYERDLGISLRLVENNDLLIETDGSRRFSPANLDNDDLVALMGNNQSYVDTILGSTNYDIGHIFSTDDGGAARLRSTCDDPNKARGATGLGPRAGDAFYIDYVAHEIGHQFGAEHTFNGSTSACSPGRVGASAVEPGSGSTIMAYAGICGLENIQLNSDATFHSESILQIHNFTSDVLTGGSCGLPPESADNPNEPVANAGADHTIPFGTPFQLSGTGSDADGDTINYQWDQTDIGTATTSTTLGDDLGNNPLFRSYVPQPGGVRDFPALGTQVCGQTDKSEALPGAARSLNFRLTVRDNKSGQASDEVLLTVNNSSGPFEITSHTTASTITAPTAVDVIWEVANTNSGPVSCANVDIDLLTFSAGHTNYSVRSLATGTPNDGSHSVNIPDESNSRARFRVKCSTNIFYDISDADLDIQGNGTFPTNGQQTFFNTNGTVLVPAVGNCSAPVFTIDPIADTSVAENSAYTGPLPVIFGAPVGTVTYSLGGADQTLFSIDATTGVVGMVARDFEAPADADANNIYQVSITATDMNANSDSEAWTVTVTNVTEADATPPVITLTGDNPMNIELGTPYAEPGATAVDNTDGPVAVVITGTVGTAEGQYTITYTATDAATNMATVTRTVTITVNNDNDSDGVPDSIECPLGPPNCPDTDGDGTPDYQDADSDGDGVLDSTEGIVDTDGDGIPDYIDTGDDFDNDGIPDGEECPDYLLSGCQDTDGDSQADYTDTDSDGDNILDVNEAGVDSTNPIDTDGDGTPDYQDTNSDNDSVLDSAEGITDTDGDGIPDYVDAAGTGPGPGDSDGDWILDIIECELYPFCADSDADSTPDYMETDSDNDGMSDASEANTSGVDSDSDGIDDNFDIDTPGINALDLNADGIIDTHPLDSDGDGTPDYQDTDSDNDGIDDVIEGTTDTDFDGIPDYVDVDIAGPGGGDSDNDGLTDLVECPNYLSGCPDIDIDGQPDYLDANHQDGPLGDIDGDGIVNYIDTDDDGDGVIDAQDNCPIDANPDQADANSNGLGDACEVFTLLSPADRTTGLDPTVTFVWKTVTSPDGVSLSYRFFLCENQTFSGCDSTVVASAAKVIDFAGVKGLLPLVLFGTVLGGIGLRRRRWLMMAIYSLAIIGLVSNCGGGGGSGNPVPGDEMSHSVSGLKATTTYYWKVTASDGIDTVESTTRSFTTL